MTEAIMKVSHCEGLKRQSIDNEEIKVSIDNGIVKKATFIPRTNVFRFEFHSYETEIHVKEIDLSKFDMYYDNSIESFLFTAKEL